MAWHEGGENRFIHKFPESVDYNTLTLKRGMTVNSALINWVQTQLESFVFLPVSLTVSLLNENHVPLRAWRVVNAYPIQWQISDFDAMGEQNIVIETLEFEYQYFRVLTIDSVSDALGS